MSDDEDRLATILAEGAHQVELILDSDIGDIEDEGSLYSENRVEQARINAMANCGATPFITGVRTRAQG